MYVGKMSFMGWEVMWELDDAWYFRKLGYDLKYDNGFLSTIHISLIWTDQIVLIS